MTYIPYSQVGVIKIQPNGNTEDGARDLRPIYGIHYYQNSQTVFRMLGYSWSAVAWKLVLRWLGKKWPEELEANR